MDEVIEDTLYDQITPELLDQHNCDFAAHGDDVPLLWDGRLMFAPVVACNRCRTFKRSEGISATDLLNRMLDATSPNNEEKKYGRVNGPSSLSRLIAWPRFVPLDVHVSSTMAHEFAANFNLHWVVNLRTSTFWGQTHCWLCGWGL